MDSKESMGTTGATFAALGSRMLEMAIQRGIEIGTKAAIDYLQEEKQAARKSRYDKRLRNTRLLLKHYRSFKHHAEGAIFNVKQAKENAIDILDGLDDAMDDNLYVEGIKKSQQRTIVILQHIDEMMRYYQISCEQSGKDEEMRRYRVIMATYIDEPKKSAQEIAEKENIEYRTVYKDITAAVKPLSALIFGIDSIKLD